MNAAMMAAVPIVDYDAIAADYGTRGVDLGDLMGSAGHFDRWRRRGRLPAIDAEGVHHSSSRLYFAMYHKDPQGAGACPPSASFWHWLLKASEPVHWTETPGGREKMMPLAKNVFACPPDVTEDEMKAARERIEARDGALPEEAWMQLERSARDARVEARRSVEIVEEIVARHGAATTTGYGDMVLVRMTVSC